MERLGLPGRGRGSGIKNSSQSILNYVVSKSNQSNLESDEILGKSDVLQDKKMEVLEGASELKLSEGYLHPKRSEESNADYVEPSIDESEKMNNTPLMITQDNQTVATSNYVLAQDTQTDNWPLRALVSVIEKWYSYMGRESMDNLKKKSSYELADLITEVQTWMKHTKINDGFDSGVLSTGFWSSDIADWEIQAYNIEELQMVVRHIYNKNAIMKDDEYFEEMNPTTMQYIVSNVFELNETVSGFTDACGMKLTKR